MGMEIVSQEGLISLGETRLGPTRMSVVIRIQRRLAEVEKPTLTRCLIFGLALVPIPMIRTGSAELFYLSMTLPSPDGFGIALALVLFLSFLSLPLIPLFLAWALPGAERAGLPKRSMGALCLLIAFHPFRYYLDGIFFGRERRTEVVRMHEQFPTVWAFEYLDTFLLLGLAVLAALQYKAIPPKAKIWFHWLLFVCLLWAIFAFFDPLVGISLPIVLPESDIRID